MFSISTSEGQIFVEDLIVRQRKWAENLAESSGIEEETIISLLTAGVPLAELPQLMTGDRFAAIIGEIAELIRLQRPEVAPQMEAIRGNAGRLFAWSSRGSAGDLAEMLKFAETTRISPQLLAQMVDWAMRPEHMAHGRMAEASIRKGGWDHATCPVCGDTAEIAILGREDGARSLGCSCCQLTWRYPRLKCTGCGGEDPETMKYYVLEDAPEQQIHYCTACNTYIKTIDLRATAEEVPDLLQASLLTAHLDLAAANKGLNPFYEIKERSN